MKLHSVSPKKEQIEENESELTADYIMLQKHAQKQTPKSKFISNKVIQPKIALAFQHLI